MSEELPAPKCKECGKDMVEWEYSFELGKDGKFILKWYCPSCVVIKL